MTMISTDQRKLEPGSGSFPILSLERGPILKLDLLGFSYSCGECHRRKQKVRSDVSCPRILMSYLRRIV
jgi:hypothetical protein